MHHRPFPTVRSASSLTPSVVSSRVPTPRHSPLLPAASFGYPLDKYEASQPQQLYALQLQQPTICGLPLKYVSLVTLAVQNAALSIVMHYSRVSIPPALAYSPASAVLLNELLKGSISFVIALMRSPVLVQQPLTRRKASTPFLWWTAFSDLCGEIFSPDCWKLSIPAILYVIQNSLQFVAISNLPVASFQVTYQMKILTTAAFSVVLLRKKLTSVKWLALFFLAIGVGIVQIQNSVGTGHVIPKPSPTAVGSAHEFHVHVMNPLKGFGAVTAACFTSGLAGVYFEMVLKGSKADLWVRNVQLSLFSLIPALLPIVWAPTPPNSQGFFLDLFRNFGAWAWATVAIQVFGGLVTVDCSVIFGVCRALRLPYHSLVCRRCVDRTLRHMDVQPAYSSIFNAAVRLSSGKSSPSSSPFYPVTPLGADPASTLGLGSFMRRKSGGFGGAGSSRNSSTVSLTGLLTGNNAGPSGGRGELGLAESGELVPLEGEYVPSVPPSIIPSRAPSPTPRNFSGLSRSSSDRNLSNSSVP